LLADFGHKASRMHLARTLAGEGRLEELRQRAGDGDEYARYWLDEALSRLACVQQAGAAAVLAWLPSDMCLTRRPRPSPGRMYSTAPCSSEDQDRLVRTVPCFDWTADGSSQSASKTGGTRSRPITRHAPRPQGVHPPRRHRLTLAVFS
jgi:hypothetical protein